MHYYFRTMDELFLELFGRHRAEQMLHYHQRLRCRSAAVVGAGGNSPPDPQGTG